LVPTWITKKWLSILSSELPTVAFHASMQHAFGKGALINLLRQFAKLHKDRQQISVGFIGYPNVGKSSIVNTLRKKKVCKTAPLAGETKVWQYVMLMRRIYMIDCPGVVYPQGDTETQLILKGVVRVENVKDPENHVQGVLDRVKTDHLKKTYGIDDWSDPEDFMTKVALKGGKLIKGGEPDMPTVAKMVLNDFQRGKLPYYVKPDGADGEEEGKDDQLPINETTTDEAVSSVGDGESTVGEDAPSDEEGSLTDVDSTCSGLSDISGVSDLDLDLPEEEEPAAAPAVEKRRGRGRRAGKKHSEKPAKSSHPSLKAVESNESGVVEFGMKEEGQKAQNTWRKKLKKKRLVKHQV